MKDAVHLTQKWRQFVETFEAMGCEVQCLIGDTGSQIWYIWQDGEIMFDLLNHFSEGFRTTERGGGVVEHRTANEARKAAYQWLLSRHCVIGMAVSA